MVTDPGQIAALIRLLDEALDIAPPEREAWLAALPPEHEHLASHLRSMLASYGSDDFDAFLADGPKLGETGSDDDSDEPLKRAGELVGPYRLIREIGHGGMGTVWLAEGVDGTLKRRVALKLPRMVWDSGLAGRMRRERDIGALLEHPHIARLYDAGVDALGRPFLALEFIDGIAIDQWCDTHVLGVRERLQLFVQVARAVAYAHGRLVVHRDLKPSNVLVSSDSEVHLLDFGIAKLLTDGAADPTALTRMYGRVMTLRYASPEHIEAGVITVASDVYSLGVMLYELLTHTHPFERELKSNAALENAILLHEPVPASSRAADELTCRHLRGELDAILGKALKREATQRYSTADAFAEDVERHLRGDVVLAQPDSIWYQLRKIASRHRVGIVATSVAATAIVLGAASTLMQAHRAMQEVERAALVAQFASELLRPPLELGVAASRASPTSFIDRGAKLIRARFAGQPELQAQLYGVVSETYADMGAGALAVEYALQQMQSLKELEARNADNVRAMLRLARALNVDDREARPVAAQAAQLADQDDSVRAEALSLLSRCQFSAADYDIARATLQQAEIVLSTSSKPSARARSELYMVQAALLSPQGRAAKDLWGRAAEYAVRAEGPQSAFAVMVRMDAAQTLMGDGRMNAAESEMGDDQFEAAREFVHAAEAGVRNTGAAGEISFAWRSVMWWSLLHGYNRASYQEASAAIRRSLDFLSERSTVVPPVVIAKADFFASQARLSWGDLPGASELLDSSAKTLKPVAAARPWVSREILSTQIDLAMISGRHREAEALIREWEPVNMQTDTDKIRAHATATVVMAKNLDLEGRHDEALRSLDGLPADLKSVPFYAIPLAGAKYRTGDAGGALELLSGIKSAAPHETGDIEMLRGEILCTIDRQAEGLAVLLRAIDRQVTQFDPSSPILARTRAVAGQCALATGKRAMATRLAEQSRSGFTGHAAVSPFYTLPLLQLEHSMGRSARPL